MTLFERVQQNIFFIAIVRILQIGIFLSILWYLGGKGMLGFLLGTLLVSYLILSNNPFFYMIINTLGSDKRDDISRQQTTRKTIEPMFTFKKK